MNVFPAAVAKTANSFLNAPAAASAPLNSSLIKFGNNMGSNIQKMNDSVQDGFNTLGNSFKTIAKNAGTNFTNTTKNIMNIGPSEPMNMVKNSVNSVVNAKGMPGWGLPLGIFISLILIFTVLFVFFAKEIRVGYENVINAIRGSMGMDTKPPVSVEVQPPPTTDPPPQIPSEQQSKSILEKVLPIGGPSEVFNVSKNEFSYYDAEPLCKALGAELATYDQVKEAYNKGADWCNYGWVKGQMAIYPTQKDTYDDLQKGSEDERGACGKPGLNGGFFDNPEMRFGVNCYGAKPSQSGHDEAELMKNGRIPKTVPSLKMDQKVRIFQKEADSMGVMPFNEEKWHTD